MLGMDSPSPGRAGGERQDSGRASRGRCCPANSPPWRGGKRWLPGSPPAPAPHLLHSLLALGKWLRHGVWVQAKCRFNSRPRALGSSSAALPAYVAGEFYPPRLRSHSSERRLQGGWKVNEVLVIKKVSVLYSSAYFYETPSLVGTCLMSRSVWLRLQGQCLGCPWEGDLRSTGAEREQEMPQHQWWPAEEHLIFFRIA